VSCPFCDYVEGRFPRALIAYEDAHTIVVPSRHQRAGNLGHCLVATRAHVEAIYTLVDATAAALLPVVRAAAIAAKRAFGADGIAVRQNNEPAAGQEVFHLHVHVIPRFLDEPQAPYAPIGEDVRLEHARRLRAAWPAGGREDRE
jgi:histidine triad (HIT) family protein